MSLDHPALPPAASREWVVCAAFCWAVAAGFHLGPWGWGVTIPVLGVALALRRWVFALVIVAVALSWWAGGRVTGPPVSGPVDVEGVLTTDMVEGRYGPWALMETTSGRVLLGFEEVPPVNRGDRIRVRGQALARAGAVAGRAYRGVIRVDGHEVLDRSRSPIDLAGRVVRQRVSQRLEEATPGRALLAGFLIGDVSNVDELDNEAMRRAGLSHFTAVSGSNVALFLGLLYLALGPLGVGPQRRAVIGLAGLPIYASATAFEPSVMRASLMAGVALGGRLAGVVFEAWQLLSLAVIGLLILDPGLTTSVGLQLSVAATAGVLVGARWPIDGGKVSRALVVTLGAQTAVAPLLLVHFGRLPLVAPLANLVAAPLVAASTTLGAVGMVGPEFVVSIAAWMAEIVLWLAHSVSGWPQLDLMGLLAVMVSVALFHWLPSLRGLLGLAGALVLLLLMLGTAGLPQAGVVVLDVGQGDSILLHGGDGHFALVDGGPDPIVLMDRLHRYGVHSLDLVVLTHVHADHVTGLQGLLGRLPVARVWEATEPHRTESSAAFLEAARLSETPVETPAVGSKVSLGSLQLEVLGPRRRYASPNDQSLVLLIHGPARTMLLSGDIEVVAQAELPVRTDVLKVPHQGAATSDPDWLTSVGAELAVISVGPNDFGHPADWVVRALEETGAEVRRTDQDGDVVIDLATPRGFRPAHTSGPGKLSSWNRPSSWSWPAGGFHWAIAPM